MGFFLLKRTSSTGFDSFQKIGASSHPYAGLSLVLPILKSWSSGSDTFFQIQKPLGPKPGPVPWKHYTDFKGPLRVVSIIAFTLEIPVKDQRYQMSLWVHPLISGGIMPGSLINTWPMLG